MTLDPLKTIFATDDQLDDLSRVRIWAALSPKVTSTPRARHRWPLVAWAGIVAAAVVMIVVVAARRASVERVTAIEHVAPAGGVLALPLGPATRAVVEGPGRIVVEREGDTTAIELRSGTLYGEFTGGAGRSLRIRAAGAMIEIVGTLFAVTVADGTACLAVAHGRVRMTSGGETIEVVGGQHACAARGTRLAQPSAIDPTTGTALAHYESTWLANAEATRAVAAPSPVVAAPSPVVAAPVAPPVIVAAPSAPPVIVAAPSAPRAIEAVHATPAAAPVVDAAVVAEPPSDRVEAAPAVTDTDLYARADAAIARGDLDAADRALAELLDRMPTSSLADEARYERARLAFDRHDWAAARDLGASVQRSSPLREPAAYLGCRAALESGAADARTCLTRYIAAFPQAPHTIEARVQLVEIAYRRGGCDATVAPLAELKAASPRAAALDTWHRRCGAP